MLRQFIVLTCLLTVCSAQGFDGIYRYELRGKSKHQATKITLQGFEFGVEVNITSKIPDSYLLNPNPLVATETGDLSHEGIILLFLNENEEGLRVAVDPWGGKLFSLLQSSKHELAEGTDLDYPAPLANIRKNEWFGSAFILREFFPPNVTRVNIIETFGVDSDKGFIPLNPQQSNFHPQNLNRFAFETAQLIDGRFLIPSSENLHYSTRWESALQNLPVEVPTSTDFPLSETTQHQMEIVTEFPEAVDDESSTTIKPTDSLPNGVNSGDADFDTRDAGTTASPHHVVGSTTADMTTEFEQEATTTIAPIQDDLIRMNEETTELAVNDESLIETSESVFEATEETTEAVPVTDPSTFDHLPHHHLPPWLVDPLAPKPPRVPSIPSPRPVVPGDGENPFPDIANCVDFIDDRCITRSEAQLRFVDDSPVPSPQLVETKSEGKDPSIDPVFRPLLVRPRPRPSIPRTRVTTTKVQSNADETKLETVERKPEKDNKVRAQFRPSLFSRPKPRIPVNNRPRIPSIRRPQRPVGTAKVSISSIPSTTEVVTTPTSISTTLLTTSTTEPTSKATESSPETDESTTEFISPSSVDTEMTTIKDSINEELEVIPNMKPLLDLESIPSLPPPHPICFYEGLVADERRCNVFHECVIEKGEWKAYGWMCPRGRVFNEAQANCVRGFCSRPRRYPKT